MPSKDSFLITGCSVSGTSLLHGLISHNSACCVDYEYFRYKHDVRKAIISWQDKAKKTKLIWGNKIPYEQFITSKPKWEEEDIVKLIDLFKIVFIQRRFTMYAKQNSSDVKYKVYWNNANYNVYWAMREYKPDKIIAVSFEDLCLRPRAEVNRICDFLGIPFEYEEMIKGTINGKSRLSKIGFDLSRV